MVILSRLVDVSDSGLGDVVETAGELRQMSLKFENRRARLIIWQDRKTPGYHYTARPSLSTLASPIT